MSKFEKWKTKIDLYRDVAFDSCMEKSFVRLNEFRKDDQLQKSGAYIMNARMVGIIKSNSFQERRKISQKWHYYVSYMYMYEELGVGRNVVVDKEYLEKEIHALKCLAEGKSMEEAQIDQISYVINKLDEKVDFENWGNPGTFKCKELILWLQDASDIISTFEEKA